MMPRRYTTIGGRCIYDGGMSTMTEVVWICRDQVTPRHIKGLGIALERVGALEYTLIRIMAVDETSGAELPDGEWKLPSGVVIQGGETITTANLPAEGILLVPNE